MRKFILGIIATLVVLGLGGLSVATLGLMPTNADATPPRLERRVAAGALDASMERHASRAGSPIPPTDENLIEGMKVYTMNCSMCHGGDRAPPTWSTIPHGAREDERKRPSGFIRPPAPSLVPHPIIATGRSSRLSWLPKSSRRPMIRP